MINIAPPSIFNELYDIFNKNIYYGFCGITGIEVERSNLIAKRT